MSGAALNRREDTGKITPFGFQADKAALYLGVTEDTFARLRAAYILPASRRMADVEIWIRPELDACRKSLAFRQATRTQQGQHVYFIIMPVAGHVKVGVARNIPVRMIELQTGNPELLSLLAAWPGDRHEEAKLHKVLSAYRMQGEWFRHGAWVEQVTTAAVEKCDLRELIERLEAHQS